MNVSKSFVSFCDMWNLPMPLITEEHLKRGTKIGKILRRELIKRRPDLEGNGLLATAVKNGVEAWDAKHYLTKMLIGDGEELIANLYNDPNVRSCMTGEGDKIASFYAANGFHIAYMVNQHGETVARCLLAETGYNEVYGSAANQLEVALVELNMEKMDQLFKPGTLLHTPNKYLPYLDNWTRLLVKVDSNTIMATDIAAVDLDSSPDNDFVEDCIAKLEELLEQGYQWIVEPQKTAIPVDEGVHYQVEEYTETPIKLIIDQLQEYIDEDCANEVEPEVPCYWKQLRINGRLFWYYHEWLRGRGWAEPYRLIMDDYGMGRTVRFDAGDHPVRIEIELGEHGHF